MVCLYKLIVCVSLAWDERERVTVELAKEDRESEKRLTVSHTEHFKTHPITFKLHLILSTLSKLINCFTCGGLVIR